MANIRTNGYMSSYYYARRSGNGSVQRLQPLEAHLENVGKKAEEKAQAFGVIDIAKCAGIWHDIGKYSAEFQKRLMDNGYRTDHSTAGARHAQQQYADKKNFEYYIGRILAYCIAGHHAGLPDGISSDNSCLEVRLKKEIEPIPQHTMNILSTPALTIEKIEHFIKNRRNEKHMAFGLSFLTRMIFSCLVDADRLDAEAFEDIEKSTVRTMYPSLEWCAEYFFKKLDEFVSRAEPTEVNVIRRDVLQQCLEAAELQPGLFSLTVPTGGGKTLSSFAFALKHALRSKTGKRRIIYVIPYTSIIEQNADVFRKFLPENAVVEHHCNYIWKDTKDDATDIFETLATENWDAPVIITTSVQFFESIFSYSPSQCRKLHNIARSVVIIDEAQNLPREFLLPTIEAIRELSDFYGTSVVLCTATQPAITVNDNFKNGLENVREIIKAPDALYFSLKRAGTSMAGEKTEEEICTFITSNERVLCIVNTRGRARKLFNACRSAENLYHLSAAMCPEHRSKILDKIRQILRDEKNKQPCRVISTQLVEAGVDLDFPLVLREIAGLDSIHQAAGRCNREGKLENGDVLIFQFSDGVPRLFRQQAQITGKVVCDESLSGDIMHLSAITNYFKQLFWMQGRENLDKHSILERIAEGLQEANFPFKEIGEIFRFIPDKTRPIFIPYDTTARELLGQLKAGVISKTLFRKAQRYSVSIYESDFMRLADIQVIKPLFENFYYLENTDLYDNYIGLKLDDPYYRTSESNIV